MRMRDGEARPRRQLGWRINEVVWMLSETLAGGAEPQEGSMNHDIEGIYRFVLHADVPEMQAAGWELIGDLPGHHKYWSVLMKLVEPTLNNEQTDEK
jgi:hypothetical protein